MPIRRTRVIGGERYIVKHHGHISGINDIMKKLTKLQEKVKKRKERVKEGIKEVKTIRERKNRLLKQASDMYKKGII